MSRTIALILLTAVGVGMVVGGYAALDFSWHFESAYIVFGSWWNKGSYAVLGGVLMGAGAFFATLGGLCLRLLPPPPERPSYPVAPNATSQLG
jgi:hypothetical protein